jgi:ubiquinone/menaquinone biosynthesis C-methylase UbiE
MDRRTVIDFYNAEQVVNYYLKATANIGLWASEEHIFSTFLPRGAPLLEVGTGTGRIAFGLEKLGFGPLTAIDQAPAMVREARRIASLQKSSITFQEADARQLPFDSATFAGAVFGFNGLMQIPRRANRRQALREINRVLQPGAPFIFTTHDRQNPKHRPHWKEERKRWNEGTQKPELDEFGDRFEKTPLGNLFIHIPTNAEVREDLLNTGFLCEMDRLRSDIALESLAVRRFSDECRFWVARVPV